MKNHSSTEDAREPDFSPYGASASGSGYEPKRLGRSRPSIPEYELLRIIGQGAYGEVWLARTILGEYRAIKIVWRRGAEEIDRAFEREFDGIQRFEPISRLHPSQLAILHVGKNDALGFFYYVMELADRADPSSDPDGADALAIRVDPLSYTPKTLRQVMRQRGPLSAAECVEIGLELAGALAHLHAQGLVHRDVKPSNVIFVQRRPKLADIGLVAECEDAQSFVGTEGYVPPQGPGTPSADCYALGILLYELSSGQDRKAWPEPAKSLAARPDRELLMELNKVIHRACAPDPKERYRSAAELAAELELLQAGRSLKHKRRWEALKRMVIPALFSAMALAGTVVVLHVRGSQYTLSSNKRALRLYDRGLEEKQDWTPRRLLQASKDFTQAIQIDPNFLDAYYQLFEVNLDGIAAEQLPPHFNKAANMAAIAKELQHLAPDSAQFHTVSSYMKFMAWDFENAMEEINVAIKADPKFVRAHGLKAWYLLVGWGDARQAYAEYRAAEDVGDTDALIQKHLGTPYYFEGQYDKAIACYKEALKFRDRDPGTHEFLAEAYEAKGMYADALREDEASEALASSDPGPVHTSYQQQRVVLDTDGAAGWWHLKLKAEESKPHPDLYAMARCYARLGDTNQVLKLLEDAAAAHNGSLVYLLREDCWDPYRDQPRFAALMRKIGFRPVKPLARMGLSQPSL